MNSWFILYIVDWFLFIVVSLTVLYLLCFSITSLFVHQKRVPKARHQNRFVVLIPAYKQDEVVLNAVNSILGQSYSQRLFDVTVISDHQSEMTNFRLAQFPITLLTPNFEKSTKAKSLQYAILNLPAFKIYDVVVIIDADNIVEPDFLVQMNDAFESAGSKAILAHRLPKNRDTASARIGSVFEEINTSIFRRGHNVVGLSAALTGSGVAYDFAWFKENIMNARTAAEDKELEAMLMRQRIFVDYFDDIRVYDEKVREVDEFNRQRGRWITTQFKALIKNIRYLPIALFYRQYDLVDKIVQWMLIPRVLLVAIIIVMCLVLPFIYFTLCIKWWIVAFFAGFSFSLATPDEFVDEHWDEDFLMLPVRTIASLLHLSDKLEKIHIPSFSIKNKLTFKRRKK